MIELTDIQIQMLKQMLEWDFEYSYPYSEFDDIADKKILKKEMRGLIMLGYVEMYRGGINDDGEMFGGTGFSLNYERRDEMRELVRVHYGLIEIDTMNAMMKYGGSFVQSLAKAACHADPINYAKLKKAFPEYFEQYRLMAQEKNNGGEK